jgi:hypothetical protein
LTRVDTLVERPRASFRSISQVISRDLAWVLVLFMQRHFYARFDSRQLHNKLPVQGRFLESVGARKQRCTAQHDTAAGVIAIRYDSRLHQNRLGQRTSTKVTVLVDDLNIRVLGSESGRVRPRLPTTQRQVRQTHPKTVCGCKHVPGHLPTIS